MSISEVVVVAAPVPPSAPPLEAPFLASSSACFSIILSTICGRGGVAMLAPLTLVCCHYKTGA